jgi:hypothetical protein
MLKFSEYCGLMQKIAIQAPRRAWCNITLAVPSIVISGKIILSKLIDASQFLATACNLAFLFLAEQRIALPRPAAKILREQNKIISKALLVSLIPPPIFAAYFQFFESAKETPPPF